LKIEELSETEELEVIDMKTSDTIEGSVPSHQEESLEFAFTMIPEIMSEDTDWSKKMSEKSKGFIRNVVFLLNNNLESSAVFCKQVWSFKNTFLPVCTDTSCYYKVHYFYILLSSTVYFLILIS
jgi:hypothetical protein